jgi:hypothetical protein
VETRSSVNPASVEPEPKSKTGGFIGSIWPDVVVDKLACFLLEQLFVSLLQMGDWGYAESMCVLAVLINSLLSVLESRWLTIALASTSLQASIGAKKTIFTTTSSPSPRKALGESN